MTGIHGQSGLFRAPSLLLTTLGLAAGASLAQADQPIYTIHSAPALSIDCGPFDPECKDHLRWAETAIKVLPVQAQGGVTFNSDGVNGAAVKFSAQLITADAKSGDASLLMFDAAYLGEQSHSFRVRFTLADTEATFLCQDPGGDTTIPILNIDTACKLDGIWAYVGAGGTLVQLQKDTGSGRLAARWAEIHAVLNLLGNANDESYLKKRLQIYAGTSLDTIWYKGTPDTHGGSDTLPRGNFGISGMLRSDNNQWELRGLAGYRPNFKDFSDYTIEARTQALYHVLIGQTTLMDIGLDGQYQYNKVPANSFGDFVSDRQHHSVYVGTVLGFTFE